MSLKCENDAILKPRLVKMFLQPSIVLDLDSIAIL